MSSIQLPGETELENRPSVEAKALRINLNKFIYGTFAEIGAGQEVVRHFFRSGGASGTIAKTISAYDKNFSDAYPKSGYVGAQEKMAATYKALDGTGYDVLVNPKYLIKTKRGLFVKTISATVAGFGAKIKL